MGTTHSALTSNEDFGYQAQVAVKRRQKSFQDIEEIIRYNERLRNTQISYAPRQKRESFDFFETEPVRDMHTWAQAHRTYLRCKTEIAAREAKGLPTYENWERVYSNLHKGVYPQ